MSLKRQRASIVQFLTEFKTAERTFLQFQKLYQGIPIFDRLISIEVGGNDMVLSLTQTPSVLDLPPGHRLTPEGALDAAKKQFQESRKESIVFDGVKAGDETLGVLIKYGKAHPAWKIQLRFDSGAPDSWEVYFDDHSETILETRRVARRS